MKLQPQIIQVRPTLIKDQAILWIETGDVRQPVISVQMLEEYAHFFAQSLSNYLKGEAI